MSSTITKTAHESLQMTPAGSAAEGATRPDDTAKRRQILDGARRVFVRLGFDVASMNDVTREAGVSKSTLYVYFRSKEELFQALIGEERDRYFSQLVAILDDVEHPARTLHRYGTTLAELMLSNEAMRAKRTVIAVASRMPELGREFYRCGPQRGHAFLSAYLERCVKARALQIDDVSLAAAQFIELCTAGALRRRFFDDEAAAPSPQEIKALVDAAVRLFMAGYAPRP